jgi:hypothetical protein
MGDYNMTDDEIDSLTPEEQAHWDQLEEEERAQDDYITLNLSSFLAAVFAA